MARVFQRVSSMAAQPFTPADRRRFTLASIEFAQWY